ncbi:hypothetical protein PS042_13380 [Escherichia albertii]|uniref:hypothetical protein n=1 Tax=Escherichia albertii TaxID=208962 RepID=UPI0002BA015D|nr:hypothetical protein [Escherichia albertii]EFX6075753.1 hypothetical protein [Shigella boydii]AUS65358.1 hypothetical protein CXP54_06900 [Escherichia albertii]EAB1452834.1 hypothetical protein [Escherichia albertii]EEW0113068.1 hypothetical protein [Escherichia albertii]EEW3328365.1 hypothetical protein [Escherichia albertii]
MNDVQNRRILALFNMLYYALGNRTTCDICHKYFILVLSVMNNLTINYGAQTSPELTNISYEDANDLITELLLFIEDVDVDNDAAYPAHFNKIKTLLGFVVTN